jgi:hypothetical protein
MKKRKIKKILKNARMLLSDETRWHCGSFARGQDGNCNFDDPTAEAFCVVGAIGVCSPTPALYCEAYGHVRDLSLEYFGVSPVFVNDLPAHGYACVLDLLDAAIEEL